MVRSGPYHPSSDPGACCPAPRDHCALSAAVYPLRCRSFATTGSGRVRKRVQCSCDRDLWDDGNLCQITCNPLPPRERKIGSVGVAAGPEVAIMDEVGTLLPVGETGEIVIRGASVIQGYENNPVANRSAFTHGWFRTGDQGYLDTDGYLFITGRLKEIINRGGEKIAPREVDEVLMDHPAVAQAVTFAVPHARLGEEIAAAVVLHPECYGDCQRHSPVRRNASGRF